MTVYRIGNLVFDPEACEITLGGQVQHVQPQVRNVLLSLVNHPGEVVTKDLLVEEAWHGRRTSDESVTRCISLLRRHFHSCGGPNPIETIPKAGYRLRASVLTEDANPERSGYLDYASAHGAVPAKTAVNLLMTAAVVALLLSTLLVASDFFSLRP